MKKILSIVLAVALMITALPMGAFEFKASALSEGYYYYSVSNGKATIIDVDTSISGNVTIPSTLGGYLVTSIGYRAFYNCKSLRSITIPDSITSIGNDAFYNCKSLTSVSLPDSVTSIGEYAFYGCKSLTSVSLGDSVTSIGEYAFYYCTSLTSITIPDSVTSIGYYAFQGCTSLTSITIPDSVTSIGSDTFRSCSSLTSITIPNSVTSIDVSAFEDCTSLTSINVASGNSNYSSDNGVLFNKNKTTLICYPAGKTNTSYTIPGSVTSIGDYAFYNCSELTSITIPNSVTSIGYAAFRSCTSLTSITIPNSVTSIGESAFYYCSKLTSLTIPDSVTSIGNYAFYYCDSLTSINVSSGNGNYLSDNGVLFNKYKTILICYPADKTNTSYTIPNSVTSIGYQAFYSCDSLTSITIGDSVTSICSYAFEDCDSLTSITIPDSVTSIGYHAFYDCDSLTSITIPNSVTSIVDWAIYYCPNLTIYCGNGSVAEKYAKKYNIKYITENIVDSLANQETIENYLETDTMFKEIAVNYPAYIQNDVIDNYIGILEKHCSAAIDDYSSFDIVRLAVMEGFFKGTEVITSELLSFLGKNSKGDQWIEEATLKFLQDVESQETVIYDVWDTINETYENIDFAYGATETVSKLNLASSIAKRSKSLSSESIGKIVDQAYKDIDKLGISDAFDVTGKAFDIVDLTIYSCQLYDAEIEIINRLLEFTPENTTLYEGLTMIKKAREVNPAAYVISAYLKKEIASALGKLITKAGKYATSKFYKVDISITMAVVQLVMDVFYDYLYTGVKISDVNKAIILKEFHLTLSSALTQKHTDILRAHINQTAISQNTLDDYKFLWDSRTASLATYSEACANIAKDDARKSILESYDEEAKRLIGFDNYVKCCMTELNKDIAAGTVACNHYRSYPTRKVQSTCSSEGYTINYCLTCCKEYVSEIDAIDGHNFVATIVSPNCTSQGYTNYTCKNCRYSYNANYTSAKGHSFSVTTVKSTCLTRGYTNHRCTSCGYSYNDNYQEVSGHSYSGWVTEYDSTCSEYGSVYNDCSVCSDRIYAKIAKKPHTPSNEWTVVKDPTIYAEGLKQQICTTCKGVVNEEIIAKLINGDASGDNVIDLQDVTILARHFAGWNVDVNDSALDVDGDGLVNLNDLIHLAQYVAGWEGVVLH